MPGEARVSSKRRERSGGRIEVRWGEAGGKKVSGRSRVAMMQSYGEKRVREREGESA